jgi:hypothetical protein
MRLAATPGIEHYPILVVSDEGDLSNSSRRPSAILIDPEAITISEISIAILSTSATNSFHRRVD